MLIFVVNIRPARTFWNSTHCLLSPFTLDWSQNLWHNLMWNMAVNNVSYPIYPLSTRTEKGYITKMIPFFFCSVYIHIEYIKINILIKITRRALFVWGGSYIWLTGRPLYFSDRPEKHKLGRGRWDLACCQVSLHSDQWFQKSWKCFKQ